MENDFDITALFSLLNNHTQPATHPLCWFILKLITSVGFSFSCDVFKKTNGPASTEGFSTFLTPVGICSAPRGQK